MRAARLLEAVGCDAFVASDPFTVAWLTGFAADETWGPNPFAADPLAIVRSDATRDRDRERRTRRPRSRAATARSSRTRASRLARSTRSRGAAPRSRRVVLRGRVGVEDRSLPMPEVNAVQADALVLRQLRAVKDEGEIERIRAAIRLCDVGQAAARTRAAQRRQRARGVGRGAERDGASPRASASPSCATS